MLERIRSLVRLASGKSSGLFDRRIRICFTEDGKQDFFEADICEPHMRPFKYRRYFKDGMGKVVRVHESVRSMVSTTTKEGKHIRFHIAVKEVERLKACNGEKVRALDCKVGNDKKTAAAVRIELLGDEQDEEPHRVAA